MSDDRVDDILANGNISWTGDDIRKRLSDAGYVIVPRERMRWRGKSLAELSDDELPAAVSLAETVLAEIGDHAPGVVRVFFADALADLTIEQVSRLKRTSLPT